MGGSSALVGGDEFGGGGGDGGGGGGSSRVLRLVVCLGAGRLEGAHGLLHTVVEDVLHLEDKAEKVRLNCRVTAGDSTKKSTVHIQCFNKCVC